MEKSESKTSKPINCGYSNGWVAGFAPDPVERKYKAEQFEFSFIKDLKPKNESTRPHVSI